MLFSVFVLNSFQSAINSKTEKIIVKSENNEIYLLDSKSIHNNYNINKGIIKTVIKKPNNKFTKRDFLRRLGLYESGLNYKIANRYKYVGRYQFGKVALRDIGYSDIKIKSITNSIYYNAENHYWEFDTKYFTRYEQERAIERFMYKNETLYLSREIKRYVGRRFNGVRVTKSGILAAAHLGGAGSVKRYFRTGGRSNPKDAFGTSLKDYMKRFESVDFEERFEYKSI